MIDIRRVLITQGDNSLVDLSFSIKDSLALVGQSGSGKSLTLKALLGLLPSNLEVELDIDTPFDFIRGETLAFVPQNPFTALSPMTKISKQWFSQIDRAKELFELLGLEWRLFYSYPPKLSGGELQRIILAIALSNNPKLILLDEPTTALDPRLREELSHLLIRLQEYFSFKMLFVTHDINLASKICNDMLVIKEGRVIESGTSNSLLNSPRSSYTKQLIEASFANREFRQ